ncbi:hypothetical protein FRC08_011675 [Ceratobasidium sp. 394]|nr:hypothetical protein FRC08_011675 [Ceratobasidium sp. 394]
MAQRLSSLPTHQARDMIHLACTQLQGPFQAGCCYWGTSAPSALALADNSSDDADPVAVTSSPTSPPRNLSASLELMDTKPPSSPRVPVLPSTPQAVRPVVTTKTSSSRMLAPADAEVLLSSRCQTPTPARSLSPSQTARLRQATDRSCTSSSVGTGRDGIVPGTDYVTRLVSSRPGEIRHDIHFQVRMPGY